MIVDYEDLIGTSFEDMNCWQLVLEIYRRHGISLGDYNIGVDECKRISEIYAKELNQDVPGAWEELQTPEPLALLAIRNHPKYVSHCGLWVGAGKFIHSVSGPGVILSKYFDPAWRHKVEGVYRYVG